MRSRILCWRLVETQMNLLMSLAIYLNEFPDLKARMKDAVKTIKYEEIRSDAFLCKETVRALRKFKRK